MTTTSMTYPLLRSVLCLAMLVMCFAAQQCIADSSGQNTGDNSDGSQVTGGTLDGHPSGMSPVAYVWGTFAFLVGKVKKFIGTKAGDSDRTSSSVGNSTNTPTTEVLAAAPGRQDQTATLTTTTTTIENKVLGTDGLGSGEKNGSSSSSNYDVRPDTEGGLHSSGSSSSERNTAAGPEVTPATTTTTANAGTTAGQEEALTRNTPDDKTVNKGDAPALTQPTKEEKSDATTTSSQTTTPLTSVQTLMSTSSTAVPKDIPQTSANSTTEISKGDFTAAAKLLPKLSQAVQSADNKDGNVGYSLVFALSALVTVVVMAFEPSF